MSASSVVSEASFDPFNYLQVSQISLHHSVPRFVILNSSGPHRTLGYSLHLSSHFLHAKPSQAVEVEREGPPAPKEYLVLDQACLVEFTTRAFTNFLQIVFFVIKLHCIKV